MKHSRGHNFDPIFIKLGTNVGLIKLLNLEMSYVEPIGEAELILKHFFVIPRGQNFDSILIKLGKMPEIVYKIIDKSISK